jgi:hypothetical protein
MLTLALAGSLAVCGVPTCYLHLCTTRGLHIGDIQVKTSKQTHAPGWRHHG